MNSTQIEFKKKQKTSFCKNLFFYYYCRIITEVSMRHEDKTKIKKLSKNKISRDILSFLLALCCGLIYCFFNVFYDNKS